MKIHAIQTGRVQIKAAHVRARREERADRLRDVLDDPEWVDPLPILCWAIEHSEGVIVVDTGETHLANEPGYLPEGHPFFGTCERRWLAPDDEIGPQLRLLGIDPGDVRTVVMTHMHGDHAGGLAHFPQAEFILSTREAEMALSPRGPQMGYLNYHYPTWFAPRAVGLDKGTWESFDTSVPITEAADVRLVPTPGHTIGHVSVAVEEPDHVVLIAGDASYTVPALLEGLIDGVAQDAALERDSHRRLRELAERRPVIYLPSHDPDAPRRLGEREPLNTHVPTAIPVTYQSSPAASEGAG
ncbi:MAG TPA: N-acyl homoserine lactonase family protein [Solirubrobacteraceae bacterium]|nr:N-acyl homoserine lactonase family protein [Solirubrobacteraceae bacterium]